MGWLVVCEIGKGQLKMLKTNHSKSKQRLQLRYGHALDMVRTSVKRRRGEEAKRRRGEEARRRRSVGWIEWGVGSVFCGGGLFGGRFDGEPQAEGVYDFQDRGEFWVAGRGEGFVETFAS
jgi:hypothetical protein